MTRIRYDISLIKYISLFESSTQAGVKDCFVDDHETLVFIVQQNDIGKAIGRNGANVHRLEKALNRKIKIVEYNPDVVEFVKNLVYPSKTHQVVLEGAVVQITPADHKTRGYIIGRAASNLRNYEKITKRFFPIDEIKVI